MIQGKVVNGIIQVVISNSLQSKPFKCDIRPPKNKSENINICKELERLYFIPFKENKKWKIDLVIAESE